MHTSTELEDVSQSIMVSTLINCVVMHLKEIQQPKNLTNPRIRLHLNGFSVKTHIMKTLENGLKVLIMDYYMIQIN